MKRTLLLLLLSSIGFTGCRKMTEEEIQAADQNKILANENNEREDRMSQLEGFRKYKFNTNSYEYPELEFLPSETINLEKGKISLTCYYIPKDDLKFNGLPVRKIRYYTYDSKIAVVVVGISKSQRTEFEVALNKLYNSNYKPELESFLITKFENDKVEVFFQGGTESDFIYYRSKEVSEQIEDDLKELKSKS